MNTLLARPLVRAKGNRLSAQDKRPVAPRNARSGTVPSLACSCGRPHGSARLTAHNDIFDRLKQDHDLHRDLLERRNEAENAGETPEKLEDVKD
jgi:hypothetical protein